jgi:hypothetical protein
LADVTISAVGDGTELTVVALLGQRGKLDEAVAAARVPALVFGRTVTVEINIYASVARIAIAIVALLAAVLDLVAAEMIEAVLATSVGRAVAVGETIVALFRTAVVDDSVAALVKRAVGATVPVDGVAVVAGFTVRYVQLSVRAGADRAVGVAKPGLAAAVAFFAGCGVGYVIAASFVALTVRTAAVSIVRISIITDFGLRVKIAVTANLPRAIVIASRGGKASRRVTLLTDQRISDAVSAFETFHTVRRTACARKDAAMVPQFRSTHDTIAAGRNNACVGASVAVDEVAVITRFIAVRDVIAAGLEALAAIQARALAQRRAVIANLGTAARAGRALCIVTDRTVAARRNLAIIRAIVVVVGVAVVAVFPGSSVVFTVSATFVAQAVASASVAGVVVAVVADFVARGVYDLIATRSVRTVGVAGHCFAAFVALLYPARRRQAARDGVGALDTVAASRQLTTIETCVVVADIAVVAFLSGLYIHIAAERVRDARRSDHQDGSEGRRHSHRQNTMSRQPGR